MADIKLKANVRDGIGKNKVDKLRAEKLIPGVVYSRATENKHVQFSAREFELVLREAGMTTIINLDVDGELVPVLIKDIQNHPYKRQVLHVDFQGIKMDEVIKLSIPIRLLGRDSIQLQPSILMQTLDELDIECLPMDIPEAVEYDVSGITFDEPVMVKDLVAVFEDEKVTVFNDADEIVATLNHPQEEEVEEVDELEGVSADVPTVSETEGADSEEEAE